MRHEPNASRSGRPASSVAITGAGNGEAGSGHTGCPSMCDGVGRGAARLEALERTRARSGARGRRRSARWPTRRRRRDGDRRRGRGSRPTPPRTSRRRDAGAGRGPGGRPGRSRLEQDLGRAALVHGAVALGRLRHRQRQVEDRDRGRSRRTGRARAGRAGSGAPAPCRRPARRSSGTSGAPAARRRAARRRSRPWTRAGRRRTPSSSHRRCRRTRAPRRRRRPRVSSAMIASPSSPRSATTSVAPNARAISWRDSWRDIAMTRSAPICEAASTPHRPTAPSPTTTAVPPGRTPAATAACQPVAITSERASSDGISASSGMPSVATRLPSACVTRAYSACPLSVKPRCGAGRLDAGAAVDAGVVAVAERHDDEVADAHVLHVRADLLHHADALVADGGARVDVVVTAVGPEVGAADAAGDHLDDRVGGRLDPGVGHLLDADVAGGVDGGCSHGGDPATRPHTPPTPLQARRSGVISYLRYRCRHG